MGNVVSFDRKKKKENQIEKLSVKDLMLGALNDVPMDIDCGIILLRGNDGEALSGFFNTSFADESLLLKTLDMDVTRRQIEREALDD